MPDGGVLLICMGVSGAGKTTLARALAERHDMRFIEADDHHPESNRAHMAAGRPLTDEMREPWIRTLCDLAGEATREGQSCVLAYSGLRSAHRQRFRDIGAPVLFIHLSGELDEISRRMTGRKGHYMPASLLQSQFDDLESTREEADVLELAVGPELETLLARAEAAVLELRGTNRPAALD